MAIGKALRPYVVAVYESPACRTWQTAEVAFGKGGYEILELLNWTHAAQMEDFKVLGEIEEMEPLESQACCREDERRSHNPRHKSE